MKADLSRNTFDPLKHFTRVLMQQGRVQLDSDWNEQAAILLNQLRILSADLIGRAGGPGKEGFSITTDASLPGDFKIGLGHYYVEGVLCEADAESIEVTVTGSKEVQVSQWTLDGKAFDAKQIVEVFDDDPLASAPFKQTVQIATPDRENRKLSFSGPNLPQNLNNPCLRRAITYLTQSDYPQPEALKNGSTYLVYLDAWERHLTCIEEGSIREVALGGPDTASRAKLVWQVKVLTGTKTDFPSCKPEDFGRDQQESIRNLLSRDNGRLRAMARKTSKSTDPCIIAPDASYQGPENQLYRVEVHTPGIAGTATFKWSRENGSVTYPIVGPITRGGGITTVTLASLGRDDRYGLTEGDWVEIQDDDYMLRNRTGNLLQVQSIDRSSMQVTLAGDAGTTVGTHPEKHPLLRRWEQKQGDPAEGGLTLADNGTAIIKEDSELWLTLEDGVQIQFQPAPPSLLVAGQTTARHHSYRTGDYWLIPARTATADVEWPTETVKDSQGNPVTSPLARPPLGVKHHYALLGVIEVNPNGIMSLKQEITCRKHFDPLAERPA